VLQRCPSHTIAQPLAASSHLAPNIFGAVLDSSLTVRIMTGSDMFQRQHSEGSAQQSTYTAGVPQACRVRNTFIEVILPSEEGAAKPRRTASCGPALARQASKGTAKVKGRDEACDDLELEQEVFDFTRSQTVPAEAYLYGGSSPAEAYLSGGSDEELTFARRSKPCMGPQSIGSVSTMSSCMWSETLSEKGTQEASPLAHDGTMCDAMICCIPCRITTAEFEQGLNRFGLAGMYDSVYLPQNSKKRSNYGYAFVHFTQPEYFEEACRQLGGKPFDPSKLSKPCQVKFARLQGSARPSQQKRLQPNPEPARLR